MKPISIYNASAGSGKTYQLNKQFIITLLKSEKRSAIREILAVTFTNKAVNEMKHRFLKTLASFAKESIPENFLLLFDDIKNELDISSQELQKRAKNHLLHLLYNYSNFEVVTLDAFATRLIKPYAIELGLPQNFQIAIDYKTELKEAVLALVSEIGNDKELTQTLLDVSKSRISEGKNYNVFSSIIDFGQLLFKEQHYPKITKFSAHPPSVLLETQKLIQENIQLNLNSLKMSARDLNFSLDEKGLSVADFNRGCLPNFLNKVLSNEEPQGIPVGKWWENMDVDYLLKKTSAASLRITVSDLLPEIRHFKKTYLDAYGSYYFYRAARKKYGLLLVLAKLYQAFKAIGKRKQVVPLADVNKLIHLIVSNQSAPVIYERLGERFKHFFIDEFQDTSTYQWNNLIPLIENALVSESLDDTQGSLFIVGDAKQAIYRFRGGDTQQFVSLYQQKENPFQVPIYSLDLQNNWRSSPIIVKFNNQLFEYLGGKVFELHGQSIYVNQVAQQPMLDAEGVVRISLIEINKQEDTLEEKIGLRCKDNIAEIIQKGHSYCDICILVRNASQGTKIANYLENNDIPTLTESSLLLSNNLEVKALISFFQWWNQPENEHAFFDLFTLIGPEEKIHSFLVDSRINPLQILKDLYGIETDYLEILSLYPLTEYLIDCFGFNKTENPFLDFLKEEIFEFESKNNSGLINFLAYWQDQENSLAIKVPDGLNAVKIMTIHKSKGLQFPFVILPFGNMEILGEHRKGGRNANEFWMPVDPQCHNGVDELLIDLYKDLTYYPSPYYPHPYEVELENLTLDHVNILYVALTRAELGLILIFNEQENNHFGKELYTHLQDVYHYSKEEGDFQLGQIPLSQKKNENISEYPWKYPKSYFNYEIWQPRTRISRERERSQELGTAIHEVLKKIKTIDEIETSLINFGKTLSHWSNEDIEWIKSQVYKVVLSKELAPYYHPGVKVLNEHPILTPEGTTFIPDRVVFQDKGIIILDYKTGGYDSKNKFQVIDYANYYHQMGYKIDKKILVYLTPEITIEHI